MKIFSQNLFDKSFLALQEVCFCGKSNHTAKVWNFCITKHGPQSKQLSHIVSARVHITFDHVLAHSHLL